MRKAASADDGAGSFEFSIQKAQNPPEVRIFDG